MGKQASSTDVKELQLKYCNNGKTFHEIGFIIYNSHNSVKKKTVDKYTNFGKIKNHPSAGRPKVLNMAELKSVVRGSFTHIRYYRKCQHNTPSIIFK